MNEKKFWKIIEKSGRKTKNPDKQAKKLCKMLVKYSPEELEFFQKILLEKLWSAWRWDLWSIAYILMHGCSEDAFLYFRAWLIAKGQDVFEEALDDPKSISKIAKKKDEFEAESVLYAALVAYEKLTGKEMEREEYDLSDEPEGQKFSERELPKLYPKLCKKFKFKVSADSNETEKSASEKDDN